MNKWKRAQAIRHKRRKKRAKLLAEICAAFERIGDGLVALFWSWPKHPHG